MRVAAAKAVPALAPVQERQELAVAQRLLEPVARLLELLEQLRALWVRPCKEWLEVHAEQVKRNHFWAIISP